MLVQTDWRLCLMPNLIMVRDAIVGREAVSHALRHVDEIAPRQFHSLSRDASRSTGIVLNARVMIRIVMSASLSC